MKTAYHLILLLSLLVFIWSEVYTSHPLYAYVTSENRAEAESQPSTSLSLTSYGGVAVNVLSDTIEKVFILPCETAAKPTIAKPYDEAKKLFLLHRSLLI
jgi:hypothetical protein